MMVGGWTGWGCPVRRMAILNPSLRGVKRFFFRIPIRAAVQSGLEIKKVGIGAGRFRHYLKRRTWKRRASKA